MISEHLSRLREGVSNVYSMGNLSQWIARNTYLNSKKFDFTGREYQKDIIDDPAKTLLVVKCAQVGLSEIFARWALAAVTTQEDFTAIWTFPSASDAEMFSKARLTPVINSSKAIQFALSRSVDSVELKQFNSNSFLYTRGTYSSTGALSVPADLLIHDELDKSDLGSIAAYVSRLQAKPTKMRRMFSTPTVQGYGISLEAENARRKHQIWTCSCCNHKFIPDYENDVVIPGFDKEKKLLTRELLKDLNWRGSKLLCPKCGKEPETDIKYRQWVVENPQDNYETMAYYVSPFCAPSFITPAYLVKVSTDFAKWAEFKNQALGQTEEDGEESLTSEDITSISTVNPLDSGEVHAMGSDMGVTCHIAIGRMSQGKLLIVHREKVVFTQYEQRRRELCSKYRVVISVMDAFPYSDMAARITGFDGNAYAGIYVTKKSTENFYVKEVEADPLEGKLNLRSVMINRDVALDSLMFDIKKKNVLIHAVDDELLKHFKDMKRVQVFDKSKQMRYTWQKTKGEDHYMHACLYLKTAAELQGTANGFFDPTVTPFVSSFTLRQNL